MAAAVLDFIPADIIHGKTPSAAGSLDINLIADKKIIAQTPNTLTAKIAFKLESSASDEHFKELAETYRAKYNLSLLVCNLLQDTGDDTHRAKIFDFALNQESTVHTKETLAQVICAHIKQQCHQNRDN